MPDFGAFIGWHNTGTIEDWLSSYDRADGLALMLGHRGTSVVLVRGAAAQTAQTLLVVPVGQSTTANTQRSDSGAAADETLVVIGTDSANIQRRDRFSYRAIPTGRLNYEITRVERALHGMVQAFARVVD